MRNTAKVVNIGFQAKPVRKAETTYSQVQDKQDLETSMQGFMKSKASTKLMYQLLKIIKAQPQTLKQIIKYFIVENNSEGSQSQQIVDQQSKDYNAQLQTIILPTNQQQSFQNTQSIDQKMSKTSTIYVPKDETDSINEQSHNFRQGKKHFSAFSPLSNIQKTKFYQKGINKSQDKFYLIPCQYQPNLYFLITHFLKFKVFNQSNQNTLGKSIISKRPKTTSKNTQFSKPKNLTSPQNKPTTANSKSRAFNYKKIQTLPSDFTEDFNSHLQKIILMEKQLQNKSKKNLLLQNQLLACTQTIKDKNNEIRELLQKQNMLKKKFTYEVQKIMKNKVMIDINQIFISNLNQQNNYGKSIFQINGKKYVKSDSLSAFTQSTFMTTPKMSIFSRTNESNFRSNDKNQGQTLKKTQSMALIRKSKGANKKLQVLRLTKLIQSLRKQVERYEKQKSQMFDKLALNNSKIEKHIQKIELQIEQKNANIKKFTEEIQKLKQL